MPWTNDARAAVMEQALRLGVRAARRAPAPLAERACAVVAAVAFSVAHGARAAVLDNLAHVLPGASLAERRRLARGVIATVTRNYYDLARAQWQTEEALVRQFTFMRRERLEAAMARGRGVIVVAPHLGNFSLVPQTAARQGVRVTVAVERIQPPYLFDVFTSLRGSHGVHIVAAGPEGVRLMLAALRRGEVLVLAGDRDVTGGGVPTPFFDAPAPLPLGPATLALRTGATLLPMFTYRVDTAHSLVVVQPPIEPVATGQRADDIAATTARVARALADAIRVAPAQWAVLQRIWPA